MNIKTHNVHHICHRIENFSRVIIMGRHITKKCYFFKLFVIREFSNFEYQHKQVKTWFAPSCKWALANLNIKTLFWTTFGYMRDPSLVRSVRRKNSTLLYRWPQEFCGRPYITSLGSRSEGRSCWKTYSAVNLCFLCLAQSF